MKRTVCLFVLAGLMALSSFNRASADGGPAHSGTLYLDYTEMVADCGTFQVLDHAVAEVRITRFYYDTGIRKRDIRQFSGMDTLFNSVTGKSFTEPFHITAIIDFDEAGNHMHLAGTGIAYRLTIPGAGAVFLDIGRYEIDAQFNFTWQAGPHHFIDGDFASLCAAMA